MNGKQSRTKASSGRAMMQALELLQLAKRRVLGRSNVEQWRNQACCFSHQSISQQRILEIFILTWWEGL